MTRSDLVFIVSAFIAALVVGFMAYAALRLVCVFAGGVR